MGKGQWGIENCGCDLSVLTADNITRKEWLSSKDPIQEISGPVIDEACENICYTCLESLKKEKVPKHALASSLWLGPVPDELKGLTFA